VSTLQRYILTAVATDGGNPPRSSTANVTIHVVSDQSALPPRWALVDGQRIDDLTDVTISEDAPLNTLLSNINVGTRRLLATSDQGGAVQYHLSNNGPLELNGYPDFKIPSPNPLNDTSLMAIVTASNKLDASSVPAYVLRCRAFVSVLFAFISVNQSINQSIKNLKTRHM